MKRRTEAERRAYSAEVSRRTREGRERRARIANEFREQLMREIGAESLTASKRALIELAVSANLQMSEATRQFLRGYATPERMRALSLARGQLQRALYSLGLARRDGSDADEDEKPESIDQILAEAGVTHGSA